MLLVSRDENDSIQYSILPFDAENRDMQNRAWHKISSLYDKKLALLTYI
jgi:hypothetical protein